MDLSRNAPIFESLLRLNPWAEPHWLARRELIAAQRWNMNALNQGGNKETRDWLKDFLPARSLSGLERLNAGSTGFDSWNSNIRELALEVFAVEGMAEIWTGTPMSKTMGGGLVNLDTVVESYTVGQFKADFLLLAQTSLRGLSITEPLDISGKSFSVGLDMTSAVFHAPFSARNTAFGPLSDFSATSFRKASFSAAQFSGVTSITMAVFKEAVDFSEVRFLGPLSADAIKFEAAANFRGAQFEDGAAFCGAWFRESPDFSGAIFSGHTQFSDSTFMETAIFDGASFPGRVYVGRIPADVRQRIEMANHSN